MKSSSYLSELDRKDRFSTTVLVLTKTEVSFGHFGSLSLFNSINYRCKITQILGPKWRLLCANTFSTDSLYVFMREYILKTDSLFVFASLNSLNGLPVCPRILVTGGWWNRSHSVQHQDSRPILIRAYSNHGISLSGPILIRAYSNQGLSLSGPILIRAYPN